MNWRALTLIIVGGYSLLGGYFLQNRMSRQQIAIATVLRERMPDDGRGFGWRVSVVDYEFEVQGSVKFQGSDRTYQKKLGNYPPGTHISIRYSPDNPRTNRIPSEDDKLGIIVLYIFGAIFVGLGSGVWIWNRKDDWEQLTFPQKRAIIILLLAPIILIPFILICVNFLPMSGIL